VWISSGYPREYPKDFGYPKNIYVLLDIQKLFGYPIAHKVIGYLLDYPRIIIGYLLDYP
jgi:hypothetical protein